MFLVTDTVIIVPHCENDITKLEFIYNVHVLCPSMNIEPELVYNLLLEYLISLVVVVTYIYHISKYFIANFLFNWNITS